MNIYKDKFMLSQCYVFKSIYHFNFNLDINENIENKTNIITEESIICSFPTLKMTYALS